MSTKIHLSKWAREAMAGPNLPVEHVPFVVAEFEPAYNQPGRFHHGVSHISFMMKAIEQWRKHFSEPGVALWAAVGHDHFMNFTNQNPGDNEKTSAADTLDRLDGLLGKDQLQTISNYIVATATHKIRVDVELPVGTTHELAMFLDADNGCVGAWQNIYDAYKTGVRSEYLFAGATAAQYNAGRLAFLQNYNANDPLFLSSPGFKRFEAQAHANMAGEIAELQELV